MGGGVKDRKLKTEKDKAWRSISLCVSEMTYFFKKKNSAPVCASSSKHAVEGTSILL